MLCSKPYRPNGGSELPCGKCAACLTNKRNIWKTRLILEETQHEKTSFVTLTYNDDNLPNNEELTKKHPLAWIKRIRKAYPTREIRYYLCGEYGDNTSRPHYHIVLFGIGFPYKGLAEYYQRNQLNKYPDSVVEVLNYWKKGNIHFEEANPQLLEYSCSHIVKSIAGGRPIKTLNKKVKEYHSMSPGLGRNAMDAIVSWLSTEKGVEHYRKLGDVPPTVRINKKIVPIGKYLRNIIRRKLHLPEVQTDEAIKLRALTELPPTQKEIRRINDKRKALSQTNFNHSRRGL